MAYRGVIERNPSFAEEFTRAMGSGVGSGVSQITPENIMSMLQKQRDKQGEFGQMAVDFAKQFDPNLGPEDIANVYSEGANLLKGKGNISQQDAIKALTEQAAQRKNLETNVRENNQSDFGIWSKIKNLATGKTSEDVERQGEQVKRDLGKTGYSKQKKFAILSEKRGAEAASSLVDPLTKNDLQLVDAFPVMAKKRGRTIANLPMLKPNEKQFLKGHLAEIFSQNPNANVLQLRQKFENKGVNWRDFRDAVDDLEAEGVVNFSDPFKSQMRNFLLKPPLNKLEEFLHDIGFKER